jgi:hypothetical protein
MNAALQRVSYLSAVVEKARKALEPFKANGDPVWPKALAKLAAHDGAALAKHIVDLRTRADEALAAIDATGRRITTTINFASCLGPR